jgi:carbon storage regulator
MLVLSRRKGESVMLGDHIEIQILQSSGGQVRIGIRAPKDLAVLRGELYNSLLRGNHEAARTDMDPETMKEIGRNLGKKKGPEPA